MRRRRPNYQNLISETVGMTKGHGETSTEGMLEDLVLSKPSDGPEETTYSAGVARCIRRLGGVFAPSIQKKEVYKKYIAQ